MNHWLLIYEKSCQYNTDIFETGAYKKIISGNAKCYFQRDGKFSNDQLFAAGIDGLIVSDGVILNLGELKEQFGCSSLEQVIRKRYRETDKPFFSDFIGPFCGAYYDKNADELVAYTNQTGDGHLFYYHSSQTKIVSNDCNMIVDLLRANKIPYTLDETAVLYLLTYGYMVDESTMISEIKRILPGQFIDLNQETPQQRRYHRFSFEEKHCSFDEAIELVDAGFRKAVKRCFDKDREYGTEFHWMDMSGGMDSRMTAWVAKDMGYDPLICFSYAQSGSEDFRYPGMVAEKLGAQSFTKQLDDASFLYDIDRIVKQTYGQSIWFGPTGAEQMLRIIDHSKFGLKQTGQIGDAVIGTIGGRNHISTLQHRMKYSQKLPIELSAQTLSAFQNSEEFVLYTRAFMGPLTSHLLIRNYMYAVSPFADPDFLQLCVSLPMEYRMDHKLYWAWVERKYPSAGKIPNTRRWTIKRRLIAKGRRTLLKAKNLLSKLGIRIQLSPSKDGMNPFDYWFATKPEVVAFVEQYYRQGRSVLDSMSTVATYVDELYTYGTATEKLMALNVIAVVKHFFT